MGRRRCPRNQSNATSEATTTTTSNLSSTKPNAHSLSSSSGGWLFVDPARIRFQHARIRRTFSGCGTPVEETLNLIRQGLLKPSDLPPILVIPIPGPYPDDDDNYQQQPWYVSLNNRRLWVLKQCRDEGLLQAEYNNLIRVRVRAPKSAAEAARYGSLEHCALHAKFMGKQQQQQQKQQQQQHQRPCLPPKTRDGQTAATITTIPPSTKNHQMQTTLTLAAATETSTILLATENEGDHDQRVSSKAGDNLNEDDNTEVDDDDDTNEDDDDEEEECFVSASKNRFSALTL